MKNEIGEVILPFVVIRRLDCILKPFNGRNAVVTIQLENMNGYYDVHLKRKALKWYIHHVSVSDKKPVSIPADAQDT